MDKPFKIGFIGAGGIALHHMKFLKPMEDVRIVAAADISEKALAKAKESYSIDHTYADYKEMLAEHPDLDAVDVCTPNNMHAPAAIAALKAGMHVLVEKPMAMNAREAQAMCDAAKKARKHLVIGFQYRFEPRTRLISQRIARGEFGKILYVRAQAMRRRGIPGWGVFGRKDLQGGGPMIDIGVHVLEMSHFMMGSPRAVSATANTWTFLGDKPTDVASPWGPWDYKTYTVEDMAIGMIRFDTGALLTIEASFVAHIEKDIWNVQVMGEKGGANWETSQIFTDVGGHMMTMTPAFLGTTDPFEAKMKHFVEVCRGKRPSESTGEHGLMVQKMLDGVYASAELRREVEIR